MMTAIILVTMVWNVHPVMSVAPTDVRVEDLLHHQLEELFGNASFVDALLPLELDVELLLQVGWVLHGDHLQLGDTGWRGKGGVGVT